MRISTRLSVGATPCHAPACVPRIEAREIKRSPHAINWLYFNNSAMTNARNLPQSRR